MKKKNIVIIGGGFAGSAAVMYLGKRYRQWSGEFDVVLVDYKENSEFLPMLPDIVSGRISAEAATYSLQTLCRRNRCSYLKGLVTGVDTASKKVYLDKKVIVYEYLMIAAGSTSNFYGKDELERSCLTMNNVEDALKIRKEIIARTKHAGKLNVLVIGGGYTGIETATSVLSVLRKTKASYNIMIVEKASGILTGLPDWIRGFSFSYLKSLGINILVEDTLENVDKGKAYLGSGKIIDNALCIWSAGVKTPDFLKDMPGENVRSRLKVKNTMFLEALSSESGVLVLGDSAAFYGEGEHGPVRMAVMFAISQGRAAAANVMRSIKRKKLKECRVNDLGYVIPLSGGKAPGVVMGINVPPFLGFFLHYFMCVYRSFFRCKLFLIRDLAVKKRRKFNEK